jgi:trimethylamine--corrinoid protein Co-methyltransferase
MADDHGSIRPATPSELGDVRSMHAANKAAWDEAAERYEGWFDEAVELIHEESLKILEEVGCEFRDAEAVSMWQEAGADVRGTRIHIDRALLMSLIAKVPPEFTLNARNPARTVRVGGKNTIFVPM